MYDQVVSEGEDVVPTNELSIVPRQRRKWLNIVLDVNGVLGQCIPKFELGRVRRMHEMRNNIFSHETPTIVGGKAVYARQNLREFLRQLSNIAVRIVVWTSMVRSNVDLVASYLSIIALAHHSTCPFLPSSSPLMQMTRVHKEATQR